MKQKEDKDKINKEIEIWKNKFLRALADYQNLERRGQERFANDQKNAVKKIVLKFLAVIDDLEKAQIEIKNEGLKLIIDKFYTELKSENIERKDCLNQKFNPDMMECVSTVEGNKDDEVISQVRPAYTMNEEVIRTAQVIVSKVKNI